MYVQWLKWSQMICTEETADVRKECQQAVIRPKGKGAVGVKFNAMKIDEGVTFAMRVKREDESLAEGVRCKCTYQLFQRKWCSTRLCFA